MSLLLRGPPGRVAGCRTVPPSKPLSAPAVRARRKELAITQEELALRSGLHQRWISNVENGHRNPSYGSLRRLAAGLELAVSALSLRPEGIRDRRDGARSGDR